MSPLSQVPEIRAAIEEEAETRDAAFIEAAAEICGLPVLPLTLRRYLVLGASRNAFVTGGNVTPVEAARFLWCLSPEYSPDKSGLDQFCAAVGKLKYGAVLTGIADYLDFAFFDAPAKTDTDPGSSYYSFAAYYLDLFGREYGWNLHDVMDCPLPVLFQMTKRIHQRNEPNAILFNPLSDRAKAEYARRLTEGGAA